MATWGAYEGHDFPASVLHYADAEQRNKLKKQNTWENTEGRLDEDELLAMYAKLEREVSEFLLRSALLSDGINNPHGEFEGLTPNQVMQSEGLQPIIERGAEIRGYDLEEFNMGESDWFPLELDRERDNEEVVFEALMSRFTRMLSRSWYQESNGDFQGRTAREVLRSEGGEDIVISQIRQLAIN